MKNHHNYYSNYCYYNIESGNPGLSPVGLKGKVITATGSPAEDKEEERALDNLWNLMGDAEETQANDEDNLSKNATLSRSRLWRVISMFAPRKIRKYCQDPINLLFSHSPLSCLLAVWLVRHRESQ